MKSKTIRIVIFLAILSMSGIIFIQIFWLKHAFDLKDKQFNHTATIALQNVGEQILNYNRRTVPLSGLVNQISSNYFVITTDSEIETNVLEFLLIKEFEKRNLLIDFEYGVYSCQSEKMVYGNYISYKNVNSPSQNRELPVWKNDQYYFVVYFPDKESNLIGQLGVWLFLNFVMLLVCFFFAYSIFVILKQKRLWEVQNDFINNMTHEFKTPLSTILVSTELLCKNEVIYNPKQINSYANIIRNETLRLKTQVEQVLKAALLDYEKNKLVFEPTDVHDCINNAYNSINLLLTQKMGKIHLDLSAQKFIINADCLHITNVFFNLMDNAVKYSFESPEILISSTNIGSQICISIQDNGIGMDKKNIHKIFDRFYRVPTGNIHNVKGFGLGLFYVKKIIKSHKGSIKVSSEIGKGSNFIITLPLLNKV